MPWTYPVDHRLHRRSPANGRVDHGYNGAFIDRGNTARASMTGKLDWINKFKLRFYMDHTAAKGYLHLWDGGEMRPHANAGPRQRRPDQAGQRGDDARR